ncbi:LysR family transcriptional regulator [Devosia yakushimensis]|uniref:LysR family transcriptional regulator n=1 Tax=Devosia yakushimensis TaxID=470028 RepID=A0ABQ5UN15_9HYPH|nr:LysR substrate-binding domain-containing protein [Devosia yakushimensis]GLQ12504.1 LysR family transcriptional regulator [Devosia yakushimensis]
MVRALNLRQIEAFKAVMENGTISRAAEILHVSQPNMSKLIAHLEADTGLQLFDRHKGRLAPTDHAMRLYDEVGRIFSGVRQVENAVEAIRREEQGRIAIGAMSTLANSFVQRATTRFLVSRPSLFCSIHSLSSPWIVDGVIARKLDIGLVSASVDSPNVGLEPLMKHPLVCIMPLEHPLAEKPVVEPHDLDLVPFITFPADTYLGRRIEGLLDAYKVRPQIVLVANVAPTVCEFVSAGVGIALVHPLTLNGLEQRLTIRRFEPEISYHFQLCRNLDSKNAKIIDAFAEDVRHTAADIAQNMLS